MAITAFNRIRWRLIGISVLLGSVCLWLIVQRSHAEGRHPAMLIDYTEVRNDLPNE